MNLPGLIRTTRWMIRDTFRQALHTKLFWVMAALTLVATAFCLSVEVYGDVPPARVPGEIPAVLTRREAEKIGLDKVRAEGIPVIDGHVSLGFGAMTAELGRDREDVVRLLELWLVGLVADNLGILLALLWTAGFLPTFLEPQSATVLLAKPTPRWAVLLGKYLGVVLFVGLYGTVFVAATWTALGLKTGVWFAAYWLAVPLLVLHFGVFYAVSAFLAVWTRSTVASAFGTLLFWFVCWGMNYAHHRLGTGAMEGLAATSHVLLDAGYWFLPKPLDFGGIFHTAMQAQGFAMNVPELERAEEMGRFRPELSVLASAGFAAATLGLAAYELEMTDY